MPVLGSFLRFDSIEFSVCIGHPTRKGCMFLNRRPSFFITGHYLGSCAQDRLKGGAKAAAAPGTGSQRTPSAALSESSAFRSGAMRYPGAVSKYQGRGDRDRNLSENESFDVRFQFRGSSSLPVVFQPGVDIFFRYFGFCRAMCQVTKMAPRMAFSTRQDQQADATC